MKFLIIEDDSEIVETMSLILKMRWSNCTIVSVSLGNQGLELVETEAPDLIILDLGLPDISGFEVLKQMRTFSNIPTIIITVRGGEVDLVKGLELGADDYIVKPFGQAALLARVQAVIRRAHLGCTENVLTVGKLQFHTSFSSLHYDGRDIILTNIESLILYQLMSNPGVVFSHTMLAEKIWGDYYPGVVNNIRVYIKRLRSKLEKEPHNPQLICTKIGAGYYLKEPPH